jgi:hypothetical protein
VVVDASGSVADVFSVWLASFHRWHVVVDVP